MKKQIEITKNKERRLFWGMAVLSVAFGLYGFYTSETTNGIDVVTHTIGLFFFAWTNDSNTFVDIAQFLAMLTTMLGVSLLFFRDLINKLLIKYIQRNSYNLVVGIDEQTIALLDNKERYIIIEKEHNSPAIEQFKNSHLGILIGDPIQQIRGIHLDHMRHAIISTGNDRENIAISRYIIEQTPNSKEQTIHTQIVNRDLNALFRRNDTEFGTRDIVTYSLYENMAKLLFKEHTILGNMRDIIESDESYSMILVGNSPLAMEIIYHIAILSHLPNQNHLKLYCIDRDAKRFCSRVEVLFSNISQIPHIDIIPIELDYEGIEFYRDALWSAPNLSNIYIATDDEEKNLDIAINLQDTTYVKAIAKDTFKTKVLFAIYHNLGLSESIDANQTAFANFYTFGSIADASTEEIVIDDALDYLAQLIHYDYDGNKISDDDAMHQTWLALDPHKRDSNKAQALHIDTKLLSLGLKRVKSDKSVDDLQRENSMLFFEKLCDDSKFEIDLDNYTIDEFPKDFDKEMIDKLARAEHNRWDAYHYLTGWSYNQKRDNDAKEHDCLKPIEEFSSAKLQETYKYDLASVYYIPVYLAKSGYGVESIVE